MLCSVVCQLLIEWHTGVTPYVWPVAGVKLKIEPVEHCQLGQISTLQMIPWLLINFWNMTGGLFESDIFSFVIKYFYQVSKNESLAPKFNSLIITISPLLVQVSKAKLF